ncbi:M15 family metallopeptidase [Nakamurella sp.]|uniref:M15 family metallopeptidase n=1 Tax=Nakamurella sp. TaxID=1869182 RepID=UPI0037841D01
MTQDDRTTTDPRSLGTARRTVLQAGALTIGTAMLGIQGAPATAAPTPSSSAGRAVLDPPPTDPGPDPATGAGEDGAPPPPGQAGPGQRAMAAAGSLGATSYNGWTVASPPGSTIGIQNFTVPGTSVVLPIRSGDVATILLYVAQRFNAEVEPILAGQCWGYSYRPNVNNPSVWSNHASGTAIDLNAVKHPNGGANTFSSPQIAAVRRILSVTGDTVYWGQDYRGVVDGMHFEINVPPGDPRLAQAITRIRGAGLPYVPGVDSYRDGAGVRHVFGISPAGRLQELTSPAGSRFWQVANASNGGYVLGTPAVTYRNGRCDVFAIGGDAAAWTQYRVDGGGWSPWQFMGGAGLAAGLTALVDSAGRHHVFCVTKYGEIWQYEGSYGTGWGLQNVTNSGILAGTPAAVYRDGRYDVFGIGMDRSIWQMSYVEGSAWWTPWRQIGGTGIVGGVEAVRDANGAYRVVGVDSSSRLQQLSSSTGSTWSTTNISNGGQAKGTPALLWNSGSLDVAAIGLDTQCWVQSTDGNSWSDWVPMGGAFG